MDAPRSPCEHRPPIQRSSGPVVQRDSLVESRSFNRGAPQPCYIAQGSHALAATSQFRIKTMSCQFGEEGNEFGGEKKCTATRRRRPESSFSSNQNARRCYLGSDLEFSGMSRSNWAAFFFMPSIDAILHNPFDSITWRLGIPSASNLSSDAKGAHTLQCGLYPQEEIDQTNGHVG